MNMMIDQIVREFFVSDYLKTAPSGAKILL